MDSFSSNVITENSKDSSVLSNTPACYPISPLKQSEWQTHIHRDNMDKVHQSLKHPKNQHL